MEKKRLKIGVFGARMGGAHTKCLKAMKEIAYVSAICEKDESIWHELDGWLEPETKFYTDFDAFIHSGMDAVILANYFDEHAIYAIKAFEAGVDVLSETTAAPTLAQCVALVEAAEKYGRKYSLALNCTYFTAVANMKKMIQSGEMGKVFYGEAEYIHAANEGQDSDLKTTGQGKIDYSNIHWRKTLPTCYYNMHTLGPLMYITGSVPKTVYCSPIINAEHCMKNGKLTDSPGSQVITKMNDGSVFNTTGCSGYSPTSKWYRINCEKGCLETERYDYREERLIYAKTADTQESTLPGFDKSGLDNPEIKRYKAIADTSHHGGINFYTVYHFVKYLQGEEESEFDVYMSAALSATGILAWYSALTGKEFRVPDFRKKEERECIRYDTRKPFGRTLDELTLPCRIDQKDQFDLYDEKYKFTL